MLNERNDYWFPAKRYGWGWGPPVRWQGWVVLIGRIAIVTALSPVLASRSMPMFLVFIVVMVSALMVICFKKGEPPMWRWGK